MPAVIGLSADVGKVCRSLTGGGASGGRWIGTAGSCNHRGEARVLEMTAAFRAAARAGGPPTALAGAVATGGAERGTAG